MKNISLLFSFLFVLSCSNDSTDDITTPPGPDYEVWTGAKITFIKAPNTDAGDAANQDSITSNLAITRSTSGGQIFNAVSESDASQTISPRGTKWAVGDIADVESLSFSSLRSAVGKPKYNIVGKNLVMYIEADNVYLSVKFLSWASGQSGGFSYERSTKD
jgi:hypothetical protein